VLVYACFYRGSLIVVRHVLHYLQGTTSYGMHITWGFFLSLHGFTNADWDGGIDDCKSTGGYLVYLSIAHISWKSGK
jgi:hypothetical protein